MNIEVLKIVVLAMSGVSVQLTSCLFGLAVADLLQARREHLNGPIQFMTWDNVRHQGGLTILSLLMFWCAVEARKIDPEIAPYLRPGLWILLVISGAGAVDALFGFYRRRKMSFLVGEYMGQRGGRRKTDPPA